jgi:TrmH family RNA methyltransferase
MRKIQSPANPLVKEALRIRDRGARCGRDAFIIEGPNLVAACLAEGRRSGLVRVFATADFIAQNSALTRRLKKKEVELLEVNPAVLRKLSTTVTPQGIAALAYYRPPVLEALSLKGVTVVCDGIQDPGNLGAIIRTSDALGCDAVVVLEGSCDPFMPKALRATAGSVFSIPVVPGQRERLPELLRQKGVRLVASDPHGGVPLAGADLSPPVAIAFGSEAAGMSPVIESAAGVRVNIPIRARAESLNVSASAAIVIYEAARQASKGRKRMSR